MDLIYADKNKIDVGTLLDYSFDLAFGSGENDFELTVSTSNNVISDDYLIYIEGTDYGGLVDAIEVDTARKIIKYSGRTYQGILEKKVIAPDNGQDYFTVSGDVNVVLKNLITRLELNTFFKVSEEKITNITYQFPRYINAYDGIKKMLATIGYKLCMKYEDGYVWLIAAPIVEYEDEGLDSDRISFEIKKTFNPVNHLICLGTGELKNRVRIDLYVDNNGNVTTQRHYSGLEEIVEIYDYPNAESTEELTRYGTEKLLEYQNDELRVNLGSGFSFDIGDKVTATDIVTGISVTQPIKKKIVTINKGLFKVEYTVGE